MKGICFIEPLYHEAVIGAKTQTRRIITPQPEYSERVGMIYKNRCYGIGFCNPKDAYYNFARNSNASKYKVGEIVYIKEPYILYEEKYQESKTTPSGIQYAYKYGNHLPIDEITGDSSAKWKNKLFMPESAARHFVKITAVRAERLQDISDEDCLKEGIEWFTKDNRVFKYGLDGWVWSDMPRSPKEAYATLIDKINGKGTWNGNPWVWVYDFELYSNK